MERALLAQEEPMAQRPTRHLFCFRKRFFGKDDFTLYYILQRVIRHPLLPISAGWMNSLLNVVAHLKKSINGGSAAHLWTKLKIDKEGR